MAVPTAKTAHSLTARLSTSAHGACFTRDFEPLAYAACHAQWSPIMRNADRVYTSAEDIDRLREKVAALPNGEHVELELEDGEHLFGIVAARPMLQQFFDFKGCEGMNGTVRLERPSLYHPMATPAPRDVWLDRIRVVRHLGPLDSLGEGYGGPH